MAGPASSHAEETDMKALVLTGYGDVDELELRDLPDPKAGPGEVRVRAAAASINPIDWKLLSGAMQAWMPLQFPAILGRDVSGEVIEAGGGGTAVQTRGKGLGRGEPPVAPQAGAPPGA